MRDFTVDQLDFLINEEANSIGMLLVDMASVEKAYQIDTFEKGEFTDEDIRMLNPEMELGNAEREQIKGNSIEYYIERLEQTRTKTQLTHSRHCPICGCSNKPRFLQDVSIEKVFLGQVDSSGQLMVDLYDDKINVPQPLEKPLLLASMKKCQPDLELSALAT